MGLMSFRGRSNGNPVPRPRPTPPVWRARPQPPPAGPPNQGGDQAGGPAREPGAPGAVVAATLLSIAFFPIFFLYAVFLGFSTDPCMGGSATGICDPATADIAVYLPLVGYLSAIIAAWVGIRRLRRRRARVRLVLIACLVPFVCLACGIAVTLQP